MVATKDLASVISKYRSHPQLLGAELTLDPRQRGAMGDTLLHFAAEAGNVDDIEVLVATGAEINAKGDIGNTPLHSAALMGKLAAVIKLVQLGAKRNIQNDFGETPLDVAKAGRRAKIAFALKAR